MILKTQIIPPELKKNILQRERLLQKLRQNSDKKLLAITAGAGYGKTTLISQFVNELDAPFVFYKIGQTDDNLFTFLSYITAGIRGIYKKFGSLTQSIIGSSKIDVETLIGTFINELADTLKSPRNSRHTGKDLFIILDDYHSIDNIGVINKALDFLVQNSPPKIHFIISSRNVIPFSTVKLKAKSEFFELDVKDLKFTSDEIRELFVRTYGLNIPDFQLREIENSSVGWVTSLQLIAYLFAKDPENTAEKIKQGKDTMDYFANEVFKQQSETIRSFLLESSTLENMTPESCNAILKIKDSQRILGELIKKNLFISCIDEEKQTFCYHQLFRDFLLNRLRSEEDKKTINILHLRAGDYFNRAKDYNSAVSHYLIGEGITKAVKIIEDEGNNLTDSGKIEILKRWVNSVPESIINKNHILLLHRAKILVWEGKWDKAIKSYETAKAKSLKKGDKENTARALLGIAFILANRGEMDEGISLLTKSLETVGKTPSLLKMKILDMIAAFCFDTSDYAKMFQAFNQAAKIAKHLGRDLDETRITSKMLYIKAIIGNSADGDNFIKETRRFIRESRFPGLDQIWKLIRLAGIHNLRGEFEQSKDVLRRAIKLCRVYTGKQTMTHCFLEMGRLHLMLGNYEISRLLCEKSLKLNSENKEEWVRMQAFNLIAMSYLFEKNLIKAEEYINKTEGQGFFSTTKALITLEMGRIKETENILRKCLPGILKSEDKLDIILVYLVFAKLYHKRQDEKMLAKYLGKVLELSRESSYHPVLTRLGGIDASMLQFAVDNGIESHYASFLLKQLSPSYDLLINFFGGLKINKSDGNTENINWRTRKAQSLFCYLLLNKREIFSPDRLSELMWPNEKASKSRHKLHYTVSCIRDTVKLLTKKDAPFINYKNGCYEINRDYRIRLDFEELESLMKEARHLSGAEEPAAIVKYEAMVNLYCGDLLPEIYEIWSEEKRQYYKEQYLIALEKLVSFYFKRRNFEKSAEYSGKIISSDEFNEPAYCMAMRSYAELGKREKVSMLYEQLKKTLKQDLNVEPSAETKSLFQNLIVNKKTKKE